MYWAIKRKPLQGIHIAVVSWRFLLNGNAYCVIHECAYGAFV